MKKVAIIMGSDSDLAIVQKAVDTLKAFNVPYEVHVYSAHRTPLEASQFAKGLKVNGFGAVIAAAGMSAHLAGVIASQTTLPVIGLPIDCGRFSGLDALLSTVQMPSGVPVATVAVNGAVNAALLCVQMFALSDENLAKALADKKESDRQAVLKKDKAVSEILN